MIIMGVMLAQSEGRKKICSCEEPVIEAGEPLEGS